MIRLERIPAYRPCDWHCGSDAEFEITVPAPVGVERIFCCEVHLPVAAVRAVACEMNGGSLLPSAPKGHTK